MKKLLAILITSICLIGCGDDVTNINGYTDDEVQAMIDSSLSDREVVMMTDTVYHKTVDTIYNMVIDTVTHELVDTIYQRVVDTVYNDLVDTIYNELIDTIYNELIDTVYNKVIDTVYKELVDTVYSRVIDTVYKTLESAGISTEVPRDTSIMLFDTTDNQITAKIYKGIVYKGVFYDTTKYQYNVSPEEQYNITIQDEKWSFTIDRSVYLSSQCGILTKPTWYNIGWTSSESFNTVKHLPGWRMFNSKDANKLSEFLDKIIDSDEVYLSTITSAERLYNFSANVATKDSPSSVSKGKLLKYMCAYDL